MDTALDTHSDARATGSKADRVYVELRRQILEVTLLPGAFLQREAIAAGMGVSRGPVGDAIARLEAEGLVQVGPRGSVVAPINRGNINECLFLRTALEVEAVRRAAAGGDRVLIARLEDNLKWQETAVDRGDLRELQMLDSGFHDLIFGASNLNRAVKLLHAARIPLERPGRLALPENGRPQETLEEHRRIADAIASRDGEFTAGAMRAHISKVTFAIDRALAQIAGLGLQR